MALHPPHQEPPGVREGFLLVPGERRVAPSPLSGAPVVGERRIVVVLARVPAGERAERLGVRTIEPGGETEHRQPRVLFAVLPRREAVIHDLGPKLATVAGDVLGAPGRESQRTGEGGLGARGVAQRDVGATEVIPRGGVVVLPVLEDRFGEGLPRPGKLVVGAIRLLERLLQRPHSSIDLGLPGAQFAGRLRRDPAALRGDGDGDETGKDSGQSRTRDGTHGSATRRHPGRVRAGDGIRTHDVQLGKLAFYP